MSNGRWFVSKTKEPPRRGGSTTASLSSRARDDDRRATGFLGRRAGSPPDGASGRSHGVSTQLVFRRQGKTVKKRDGGSPFRTEETPIREPRQNAKANSSKKSATQSDDVQSVAERLADEPLRSLRLLRERAQSPQSFEGSGGMGGSFLLALTASLEQVLGRPRLGADLGAELLACLAALGRSLPVPQARGLIEWLLDGYDLSISDESRVLLLKALLEVLKSNSEVATAMLPVVMERSQTMLENADECDLLLATADVTLWCARRDPETFVARYLRDTADILVGWHIDVAGQQRGGASCSAQQGRRPGEALEVLEALGPLWAADGAFCATLLAQFVEDLCAYAEEPGGDALDRMGALLRVHAALLRSLGLQAPLLLSWDLLSNNLHNMLSCIMTAVDYHPSETFLVAANDALGPLCGAVRECPPDLADLVMVETALARESEPLALSLLRLLGSLVVSLGPQLPISLVGPALGQPWAQGSPRPRVQKALLALRHRLLRVKSVPMLQEAYGRLLEAPRALREGSNELQPHCLGSLCALAELANMRHSIIGMWALDPTLFELLTEHLCPTEAWLGERHPALQYSLLRLLHAHCTRHGHFVSTSLLVTGAEAPSSGGHLSCLLRLLGKLLPVGTPKVSHDARRLTLEWVTELLEAVTPYVVQLTGAAEFLCLVDAVVQTGFSHEVETSLKSCRTLRTLLDRAASALPARTLQRTYELCVLKMGSPKEEERGAFGALLAVLPVNLIASRLTSPEAEFLEREWSKAGSMPPTAFGSEGLRATLHTLFLVADNPEGDARPPEPPWGTVPTALPHEGVQWCRALWGAAQLCVQGKLRTPLGKPQDTFSTLEGAIKSLLTNQTGGMRTLKRAHLVLDFLEHLERAMYNAYEGSAGILPSMGRVVRAFFKTNRATCEEWAARVRPYAARLALRAGRPALAFRHASLALATHAAAASSQDSKHRATDLPLLLDASAALILLRCPDVLVGLQTWGKTALGRELPWLEAATCHAAGRFESATEKYASLLANGQGKGDQELRPFLLQQMVECHRLLGDWQEALHWVEGETPPTNGYVGHGTYQQKQQQFLTLHLKFLSDPTNGAGAGPMCAWDGWSSVQQTLLVQHRALHGCADAAASAAELLRLRMLEWPPEVHPEAVGALQRHAGSVGPSVVGPLLPPLHCCGSLASVFADCNSGPALVVAARLARRQGNLRLARRWLLRAAACSDAPFIETNFVDDLEEHPDPGVAYEAAKLLRRTGKEQLAVQFLTNVASRPAGPPEMAARALVALARWQRRGTATPRDLPALSLLPDEDCPPAPSVILGDDSPLVALLWQSVGRCPALDKAWAALGALAYDRGGGLNVHSEGKLPLSAEEEEELQELLPDTLEPEERTAVCQLLTHIPVWGEGDARQSLKSLCPGLPDPARETLLAFHARLLLRATAWHEVALCAYCRYLHLGPTEGERLTTAALRVVRLAARLGPLLGPSLEEGLTICPTRPWKALVPQLLSLLAHPEDSVRGAIQRLLEQVGREAPHLLLFPATVEALGPSPKTASKPSLAACANLLNALAVHTPDAVTQVRSFVKELRRIAVLWDELCLGALNAHSGEAHRRVRTLEEEVVRVRSNAALSSEDKDALIRDKHAVFLRPTICLLEELCEATRGSPETPHEAWFRETLGPLLEETLEAVRSPQDPGRPQATWMNIRRLHLRLQRRTGAAGGGGGDLPSAPPPLLMERVSPALAELSDSQVPMPGCEDGEVRVTAVLQAIQVLPTKTKPKKLAFQGSDGRKYTFLFKGMEDLHLDERLMQFLGVANAMLARTPKSTPLRARRYAVTPLGPRSGLIRWLDGVTPLFSLYKRWQQRESATPPRPSEIFYGKLAPLLKEQGISNLENRREWPTRVLVETLEALMAETPRDLVAKELWLAAPSAPQWWRSTCAFSASTAVMSIIGYVVGLGDRHLDNILLDLHSGEVVHIDYNVCFEKGRQLRVPEKVPFRMTPNLEAALGLTGVEGQFRLTCQHVLQVLRNGSEPLLSLLEALVWDPLVSWGDGDSSEGSGNVGGGGEWGLARALLSLRLREGAAQWKESEEALDAALVTLEGLLRDCQAAQNGVQAAEQRLEEACAQQTLLEEALASEDHPLRSLPQRQRERLLGRAACDAARGALGEKLQECSTWGRLQEAALATLRGPQLEHWNAALAGSADAGAPESPVVPLCHFLRSSGQGQLMQQCEQREAELRAHLGERRRASRNCVELVHTFGATAGPGLVGGAYLPQRLRQQRWNIWLQGLAQEFSLAKCQEVISEFHHLYGVGADLNFVQVAHQQHYDLQSSVADLGARIMTVLERKQAEGTDYLPEAQAALLAVAEERKDEAVCEALVGALCRGVGALLSLERIAAEDPRLWAGDEAPLPLEDLCSQAALLLQLANLLPHVDPRPEVASVCRAVGAINDVFSAMLDLSLHFETIIVPESLQRVADASVAAVAASLRALAAPQALEELLARLHAHGEDIQQSVASLREKFQHLLENDQMLAAGLSPGQMLLLGFNGLFAKLGRETAALRSVLDGTGLHWNNVDVVWGARALSQRVHPDESSVRMLEDALFVHSLCVMQQFFCCQLPTGSLDQMLATVRFFLADFYRNQVAGLPTLCVASAVCSLTNCPDRERVSLESLGTSTSHPAVASLEAASARRSLLARLERAQLALQGRLQRAQMELATHRWLHQDVLPTAAAATGSAPMPPVPPRSTLLAELRKGLQVMACAESNVQESWEAQGALWQALEQRLRWATGANPSLAHTQQHFAQLLVHWEQHLQGEAALMREIRDASEGLLQLESQRPGAPEAQAWDGALLALLNRCQESCLLLEGANASSAITPIEEQLLALAPPPEATSASTITDWLRALLRKVDLGASRKQLEEAKASRDSAKDALQVKVVRLRGEVLGQHHKLMSEVRSILKTLARQEGVAGGPVQEYLSLYRNFSDCASQLVRDLLANPLAEAWEPLGKRLLALRSLVPEVYRGLTALVQERGETQKRDDDPRVTADHRTGRELRLRRGRSEQKSHATSVWKRVKTKLDGQDPDPSRRSSVDEQVDFVIREATRLENLALLYEGWTPWV